MSRREKIVGWLVGLVLFSGLFYLIYDSFMAETTDAAYYADTLDEDVDYDLGEETGEAAAPEGAPAGP